MFIYFTSLINIYLFIFNLIDHSTITKILTDCNSIIKFFKMSHIYHDLLSKSANTLKISGGGLKSFIKTRWTSMYESTYSIVRMRRALEEVIFSIFMIIYYSLFY